MFVSNTTVPIFIDSDPDNKIHIKTKLNFGGRMRVQKALLSAKSPPGRPASEMTYEFDSAAYQTQLLVESIVSWEGPAFAGRPCTAANIMELDVEEPLVDKVITEVSNRNKAKGDGDDPKASQSDGERLSLDVASLPSANGTSTSL